ncbi:MAG: hypothetical protein JOZ47_07615 [Kutzneria sp.]|nr:hypothetical protein [Kutzneria sp.]
MRAAENDPLPDALVLPAQVDALPPITHSQVPRPIRVLGALAAVVVSGWIALWLVLILSAAVLAAAGVSLLRADNARTVRKAELVDLVARRAPRRGVWAQVRWYSPGGTVLPEVSVAAERGAEIEQLFGLPVGMDLGELRVDGEPTPATVLGEVDSGGVGVIVFDGSAAALPLSPPHEPRGRRFLRPRQFGHVFAEPAGDLEVVTRLVRRRHAAEAAAWLASGPDWTDVRLLPVRGQPTRAVLADPEAGTLLAHVTLPWRARRLATRPLATLLAVRSGWRVDPRGRRDDVEALLYGPDWPVVVLTTVKGGHRPPQDPP